MNSSTTYIESARIRFVIPTSDDFPVLEELLSEPLSHPQSEVSHRSEENKAIARWIVQHWVNHSFGPCLLEFRSNKKIIGIGGLKELEVAGNKMIDLGMSLTSQYQNQGLGSEIGQALLSHGFNTHGFEKIVANTSFDNKTSLHLLHKWGFSPVGSASYEVVGSIHSDAQFWAINRSEWMRVFLKKNY